MRPPQEHGNRLWLGPRPEWLRNRFGVSRRKQACWIRRLSRRAKTLTNPCRANRKSASKDIKSCVRRSLLGQGQFRKHAVTSASFRHVQQLVSRMQLIVHRFIGVDIDKTDRGRNGNDFAIAKLNPCVFD